MKQGNEIPGPSIDARVAKILASVEAGNLVVAMSHDGSFVVSKFGGNQQDEPAVIRDNLATGCRYIERRGHKRVPMDSMALYNLLGATLLLPDGTYAVCDGFATACKGFPDLISAGGKTYTAQELVDRQVQCRPFGSTPDTACLPCWKVVLDEGTDL